MKPISLEERKAAAARLKAKRSAAIADAKLAMEAAIGTPREAKARAAYLAIAAAPGPIPFGELLVGQNGELVPDYAGFTPNYANSPMPIVTTDPLTGEVISITGGIRKFVDTLPGIDTANTLGQSIPMAVADTTTYADADYYEIEVGEYERKMHTDLPPTRLRGYRQTNHPSGPQPFQYLGPLIAARKGRPVRITFTNSLPTGAGGNLFIPVDPSVMGAGPGAKYIGADPPDVACQKRPGQPVPAGCLTENRATIHLHGGVTPWISDGTTHQWITPAGENPEYPEGVSVFNVPDMPNPGKPGSATNPTGTGKQTFYYSNEQSARLMFYHEHAHGITRLAVYAGMAAPYLVTDATEEELLAAGVLPAEQIPLVIQDKTFVDATTIRTQDPTWSWGTGPIVDYTDPTGTLTQIREPKTGDLWWPHVYQPAQNPYDLSGMNAMGRWHYGPWFWPPTTGIAYLPVPNAYYDCNAEGLPDAAHPCTRPWQPMENPGTPNPSWGAEAFLDTPVINGTAYPTLTVEPKAYRFRILNAAHDRFWNLQLYRADTATYPAGSPGYLSEVVMTAASPTNPALTDFPTWPRDGREGGVPDPAMLGPDFVQVGTEGGFLPMPVVVKNQPIAWNLDPTTFNFGNVSDHALLLGPAERADVIVDFSAYAGQTLILYNDAPAAFPALDARNDYYTGAPDLRDVGGVAGTLPGYGPNIRTIMQIKVGATVTTPSPFSLDALTTAWAPVVTPNPDPTLPPIVAPGVFGRAQDPIIVGQTAYNEAYGMTFPAYYPNWGYARIQDFSMRFQSPDGNYAFLKFETKAIQDEMGEAFDDYGRMSAKLGLELPNAAANNQLFVLQGFNDPPTELVKLSKTGTPIGALDDGTQIWKITHNGVDTHPIHFHLFHVQLINRVGWDGAIRLPDANELGWKDTVRVSPLEDTIVALRPLAPSTDTLPWKVPNSFRPLNPTLPLGSTLGFANLDPLGNPITIVNQIANFGWEYVWHCHILSHEENDMMRAVAFAVPPEAPTLTYGPVGKGKKLGMLLSWVDNSITATGFTIQRASDVDFTQNVVNIDVGLVTTYTDPVGTLAGPFYYRMKAVNTVGSTVVGYPTITAASDWSNWVGPPQGSTTLAVSQEPISKSPVVLSWTYAGLPDSMFGFLIQRDTDPTFPKPAVFETGLVNTFSDGSVKATTLYYYRVAPLSDLGPGYWSNTASITTIR